MPRHYLFQAANGSILVWLCLNAAAAEATATALARHYRVPALRVLKNGPFLSYRQALRIAQELIRERAERVSLASPPDTSSP